MKHRILLIEDDPTVRENIYELLTEEGFSVDPSEDGSDGLKLLKSKIFSVILCDIMLPNKTGYDLLKEFKDEFKSELPPFVFLTAKAERESFRFGMELGADDYITKPFTRDELLKSIDTQIKKRGLLLELQKSSEELYQADDVQKKAAAREKKSEALDYDSTLFLDYQHQPKMIKIAEIVLIKSKKDYSEIITVNNIPYTIKRSMNKWMGILPPNKFLRVHRSYIVNKEFIVRIEKWFNYSYNIILKYVDEKITVSQRFSRSLRKQLRD